MICEAATTDRFLPGYWICRDDGEVVEGPFDTADEAFARRNHMYDPAEYAVVRLQVAAS